MLLDVMYYAFQLIIQSFVSLYVAMVCLRILLHWANVSYANPILLSVAQITSPCLKPIYSIIPTINGLDLASIVLLSFLSMGKIAILFWLKEGYIPLLKGLFVLAFSEILGQFIDIFVIVIVLFSLMSWLHPLFAPALFEVVLKMAGPLLRLAQKVLPPIANLDFSPLLVIVCLQLLGFVIVAPLSQLGLAMIKTGLNAS